MRARTANHGDVVAAQVAGVVGLTAAEGGATPLFSSPFQQFLRRKRALHRRLTGSFIYSLLSVYHAYYIFGSVIMGLSMGMNFSLGWFVWWFQKVRGGSSKPDSDWDVLISFFGVLLRSWLLLRTMSELIRASVWLLEDAWRSPATAFQLYRACMTGGAFRLMCQEPEVGESRESHMNVAGQLSRSGGWSYHYNGQWALDLLAQAFIYITFDIVPMVAGVHTYIANWNEAVTWLRWLSAVQKFQLFASSAAALHVFFLFLCWTLNDLAAKVFTLPPACRRLGRASREEVVDSDPEDLVMVRATTTFQDGEERRGTRRQSDEVELQEARTFTSAAAGGTFASTRGPNAEALAGEMEAGRAEPQASAPARPSVASVDPAGSRPSQACAAARSSVASAVTVSTTSTNECSGLASHEQAAQAELSNLMVMVVFVLEQPWCLVFRFFMYFGLLIWGFATNSLFEAVVVSFLFVIFIHNNFVRLLKAVGWFCGGWVQSRLRWCCRPSPGPVRRHMPGSDSLRSLRRWGERQCGLYMETCAWQYKLLWVVLALQAALCLALKWTMGFALFITLFALTFTRWLTLHYFRPYCWLLALVEAGLYAAVVLATDGSYLLGIMLTIWLLLARHESFKYQTYKVTVFVLHIALVLIVAVSVSAALQVEKASEGRRLSRDPLPEAASPPLLDLSSGPRPWATEPRTALAAAAAAEGGGDGDGSSSVGLPTEYATCTMSFPLGREVPYTVYSKGKTCVNSIGSQSFYWKGDGVDCRQRCTEDPRCSYVTTQIEGNSRKCYLSETCPVLETNPKDRHAVTYMKDVRSCEQTVFDKDQACQLPDEQMQEIDQWPCHESAENCANCCVPYTSHFNFMPDIEGKSKCQCWETCNGHMENVTEATSGRTCSRNYRQRLTILDFGEICGMTNLDSEHFKRVLPAVLPGWELVSYHEGTKVSGKNDDGQEAIKDWSTFYELSDPANTTTIFAVRGTQGALDVMQDVDIWLSAALMQVAEWIGPELTQSLEGVIYKFSTGPDTLGRTFFPLLKERIDNRIKADPSRRFYFTGHSLGGGLASLMALEMGRVSVTFSAPGLGRTAGWMLPKESRVDQGAELESQAVRLLYNVVPTNDVVPMVDNQLGTQLRISCSGNLFHCHKLMTTMHELRHACSSSSRY